MNEHANKQLFVCLFVADDDEAFPPAKVELSRNLL
jgi:hypothetical protein